MVEAPDSYLRARGGIAPLNNPDEVLNRRLTITAHQAEVLNRRLAIATHRAEIRNRRINTQTARSVLLPSDED